MSKEIYDVYDKIDKLGNRFGYDDIVDIFVDSLDKKTLLRVIDNIENSFNVKEDDYLPIGRYNVTITYNGNNIPVVVDYDWEMNGSFKEAVRNELDYKLLRDSKYDVYIDDFDYKIEN